MTNKEVENLLNKLDFKETMALAYYFLYLSGMSEDQIQKILKDASENHFAKRHKEALEAAKYLKDLPGMFCMKKSK